MERKQPIHDFSNEPESPEAFYLRTSVQVCQDVRRDSQAQDNIMFVTATGSLILSVSAVITILQASSVVGVILLFLGWVSLLLCIFTIIYSYPASINSSIKLLDDLDKWKNGGYQTVFEPSGKPLKKMRLITSVIRILLFVGIALLTIFFMINFSKSNRASRKVTTNQVEPGIHIKSPINISPSFGSSPRVSENTQPADGSVSGSNGQAELGEKK